MRLTQTTIICLGIAVGTSPLPLGFAEAAETPAQGTSQRQRQSQGGKPQGGKSQGGRSQGGKSRGASQKQGTLKAGDTAPDFTLTAPDGETKIALKTLRGKPTVLVFGSCTCPPFVRSISSVNELHEQFGDKVNFLMVYIREAHPTDGRVVPNNQFVTASPKTATERCTLASELDRRIGVDIPIAVDSIDDATSTAYSPWPNRMYILDAEGKIVDAGSAGAQGTTESAKKAPETLKKLLAHPAETPSTKQKE